VSKEITSLEGE